MRDDHRILLELYRTVRSHGHDGGHGTQSLELLGTPEPWNIQKEKWRRGKDFLAAIVVSAGLVEIVSQHLGARRVAQLGHGLGLDLANTFAGDTIDLADFV